MSITSDPDETSVTPAVRPDQERETLSGMRLLLVADLNPAAPEPDWEAGDLTRLLENADVDSVLREVQPSIEVAVPNYLGGEGPRMSVVITVDSMAAFTPAGLSARVPVIHSALLMRDALRDARDGKIDREQLQQRLQEAGMRDDTASRLVAALAPRQQPSGGESDGESDGTLARILGLVDFDGAGTQGNGSVGQSALDSLVRAVSEEPSDVDRAEVDRALEDLERRLAAQTKAILADPDFARLEAAWRGLKFLVDRAHFRGGMRVQILAASRDQLAAALHHQVLLPEYENGASRDPLTAVVIDHAFGSTPRDLSELEELAALGGSLQIPVVTSVDAAFFGYDQPTDLTRLALLRQHLAAETYIRYRKLRERPDAQFLALALPSFVLREQHADAHWREDGYLWGGGALLAAAAILGSHRDAGWPTHIADRRVENLVVRKTRMGALPLAASFADRLVAEIADSGFLAFRAPLNRDHAIAAFPATVKHPERKDPDSDRMQSTLPAAIFSALAAHRILKLQEDLAGLDAEATVEALGQRMRSFLGGEDLPEDAVTVQYLEQHDTEESRTYGVRLRPPRAALLGQVGLVLGATVPSSRA